MKKATLFFVVATLMCASNSFAASIGLNFVGGRQNGIQNGDGTGGSQGSALSAGDNTGVEAQANWNNGFNATDGLLNLVDDSNASTSADAAWASNNLFTINNNANSGANERPMAG